VSDALVLIETRGRVGLLTLNRPKALNALNSALLAELDAALAGFDADENVGAVVVTGSAKAFAAGADIAEMRDKTYPGIYLEDLFAVGDRIAARRKPKIAAVAGFALGGGCELAMICDFIIAADNAKFGQPEIRLGVMPGIGGTQRLARAVGKANGRRRGRAIGARRARRAARPLAGRSHGRGGGDRGHVDAGRDDDA
jgi:enoyl-CoA hydratase